MRGLAIGSFDLFHLGHVRFLQACHGECGYLVVAVTESNETVCTLDERRQVVEACQWVGQTLTCNGDVRPVIAQVAPDLLFHGDEWAADTILEHLGVTEAWLDSQGVTLTLVPYLDGISTVIIRDRILGSPEAKRGWFK